MRIIAVIGLAALALSACARAMTEHAVTPAAIGAPASSDAMIASLGAPGPWAFQRVVAATWRLPRGQMLDLDSPEAKAIGAADGGEASEILFYVIDHPEHGRYLIDAGVSDDLLDRFSFVMRRVVGDEPWNTQAATGAWLAQHPPAEVEGVFVTHLHFDHIGGVIDLAPETPVYVGPDEASQRHVLYRALGPTIDNILEARQPLRELRFEPDASGRFAGVLDLFGDGSLWALRVPGHTAGSTAFLVRTTDGPKLIVGDAVHLRGGWLDNIPQETLYDRAAAIQATAVLQLLAQEHPEIEVFLGHQPLPGQQGDELTSAQ